jgi:hypothetical protein
VETRGSRERGMKAMRWSYVESAWKMVSGSWKNYETIGYSNPNEKAYPLHSEEYRANKIIFLSKEELDRTEWLVDVGERLKDYDRFWTE